MNRLAILLLGLVLSSCVATPPPATTPAGDDIHIYVYYPGNGPHEPVAGAKVFLLGTDGRVITSVITDRSGVAIVPASYDAATTQYILAEAEPPFLISGVRWSAGRREYNLPLQVEPLVNRMTVTVPRP